MLKISNPTPLFLDARGALLDGGMIYIGVANADPEVSPINVFFDAAMTIPAAQPLRTIGGVIVNGTNPASVFAAEADYSQRVLDNGGSLVTYSPSIYVDTNSFQPLDSDLTAIAALSTTPFGRQLLTLVDQQALKTATGIPNPLPLAGGTLTGPVSQQGAGRYFYAGNTALTGCRVFGPDPIGTADATSQPGDMQFFY